MSPNVAEVEKGGLERVETTSDAESRNADTHHGLEKTSTQQTLAAVDVENHQAYKGDDSDGKVAWTFKKLMAAAFLSMLYTGRHTPRSTPYTC